MENPRKLCPQCQTPAPVEAGFCGRCGHQYRTQFAPNAAPSQANPPLALQKRGAALQKSGGATPFLGVLVTLIALGSFGFVVWVGTRPKQAQPDERVAVRVPTSAPAAKSAPQEEGGDQASKRAGLDPVEAEARRALERAKRNIDIPLADTTPKDSDGRIHLRGGGSVGKEDWDAARRAVQNSPLTK